VTQALTGSEYVLIAQVPKAGDRWHQVHLNAAICQSFFRIAEGEGRMVRLERVEGAGVLRDSFERQLVYSRRNRNYKIEFDFGEVTEYPQDGVPLLIIIELDVRRFRYVLLLPGDTGHEAMLHLNDSLSAVGRGLPRVITTLDEVELRWPGCPLRSPVPTQDA
jgi:hypothetical protein